MTAFPFLVDWTIRSAVLISGGALLMRAFRLRDAATRLAAYTAMLCCSLALPALTNGLPRLPLPILQPSPPLSNAPVAQIEPNPGSGLAAHDAAPPARPFDWRPLLYAAPTAVLLLRVFTGLFLSRRLLRHARPTPIGADILVCDTIASPAVVGIIRPVIAMPSDWRHWPAGKLEAVLAHERSHILRRDPAIQFLSALHRALLWHSPLSWHLHREIVRSSEDASDDAAIAATRDPAAYAAAILDFLQRSPLGALGMARYGSPEQRIRRILDATTPARGITRRGRQAIIAIAAPLALLTAVALPQNKPPSAHKDILTFEAPPSNPPPSPRA